MTPGAHECASHWHASAVQLQLVVSGADTLLSRNPAAGMVVEEARSRAGRRQVIARHPVGAVFECIETG